MADLKLLAVAIRRFKNSTLTSTRSLCSMIFRYNLAAALFVWVGVLSSQVSNTVCFAPQTVGRDPRRLARIRHTSSAARFPPTGRSQPSQPIGRSSAPLAGFGFGEGVTKVASSGLDSATSSPLFEYFMQTIISNGVPAFFTVVTFFFVAKFFRGSKDDSFREETAISELYEDLYGSQKKKGSMGGLSFGSRSPKSSRNLGIPSEQYIKVRNWNQKLDSYRFSMDSATKSKAAAAARYREKSFDRALQQGLGSLSTLSPHVKTSLLRAEEIFLREASLLVAELQSCQAKLAGQAIAREMKRMGSDITDMDPSPSSNITNSTTKNETGSFSFFGKSNSMKELNKIQGELTQLELDFVREVVRIVGPESAAGVRAALMGDYAGRGIGGLLTQLQERPLSVMLEGAADHGTTKKSLFVARFRGDVQASQVNNLREEVTAIIQSSKPGDEALVVLQTGGGTVTGYGLAAAQLLRIKEHGLKLTIAVEQVAASGEYILLLIHCSFNSRFLKPCLSFFCCIRRIHDGEYLHIRIRCAFNYSFLSPFFLYPTVLCC